VKAPSVPELTSEQIELICDAAKQTVREFVFSKVSPMTVERVNRGIEAEGAKPLSPSIEVDIELKAESGRCSSLRRMQLNRSSKQAKTF